MVSNYVPGMVPSTIDPVLARFLADELQSIARKVNEVAEVTATRSTGRADNEEKKSKGEG